jgi:hypothetical protein
MVGKVAVIAVGPVTVLETDGDHPQVRYNYPVNTYETSYRHSHGKATGSRYILQFRKKSSCSAPGNSCPSVVSLVSRPSPPVM